MAAVWPVVAQAQKINVQPRRAARERLEEALARLVDPNGEGARACLTVYTQSARMAADAADARAPLSASKTYSMLQAKRPVLAQKCWPTRRLPQPTQPSFAAFAPQAP